MEKEKCQHSILLSLSPLLKKQATVGGEKTEYKNISTNNYTLA